MPTSSLRPPALLAGALAALALVAGSAVPAHADPVPLGVRVTAPLVTLPIGDGYRDAESVVVTASAATTASVTLQSAGRADVPVAQDLALGAGATTVAIPTTGLQAGAWNAVVTTADGATGSGPFTVESLHATLTRLTLQRSIATVYPAKDGYRDSVTFTVTPTIAGPSSAKATGSAKLTRAGRTVKSWSIRSGSNRLTWNGRVAGAVKPGRYALTVTAKGPQGAAKTVRSSVVVSSKRLVTRTAVVTKQASSALSRYQPYDAAGSGTCGYSGPLVGCVGYEAADGASFSIIVGGSLGVPKAVRASTAYAAPELRVGIHTTKLSGGAVWGSAAGTAHATGTLVKGTTAGRWLHWTGNPATASVFLALDDDSSLVVDRITFTYRYRALV